MNRRIAAALLAPLALAAGVAGAARAEDKPIKFTGDISYVQTGGNTEVTTAAATDKLEAANGAWLFTQEGGVVWGETDGIESAGRYGLSLRADRALNERLAVYGLVVWRRNVFAGISRQFEEGVGLAFHALVPTLAPTVSAAHQLDLEAGVGANQRRTTLGVQDDFATARAAALYKYFFAEKTFFEATGAYLFNLDNTEDSEARGRFALAAPLSANFGLKLAYDLYYRNLPQPGLEKLDTTFSAGIQISY